MNFASAFISLQRGHKIRRHHWSGFWKLEDDMVMMYTYTGDVIRLVDTKDVMYTLSNCACDDWELADDYGASKELKK